MARFFVFELPGEDLRERPEDLADDIVRVFAGLDGGDENGEQRKEERRAEEWHGREKSTGVELRNAKSSSYLSSSSSSLTPPFFVNEDEDEYEDEDDCGSHRRP